MTANLLGSFQRAIRNLLPDMAVPETSERSNNLFDQLKFAIIQSSTLDRKQAVSIADRVELHGGEAFLDNYPQENLDLTGVTHIVSSTSDFPDYNLAADQFVPVIKPQWIEDSIARQRHVQPRQYSPDPRYFMSDVVVCCADIPEGDADAIAGGILAMGGNYTTKVTTLVTHIIALSMDNDICEAAQSRKLDCRYVLPHWFDDCLKLGRKIDERPYELPNPEILEQMDAKAPAGKLKNEHVKDALDPHPDQNKLVQHKQGTIFKKKTFMLSKDLGIGDNLRDILNATIMGHGGAVTDNIKKAHYLVCKYREGPDFQAASKKGIDVGNLAWLYYLIINNQWTSPFRRLLHYPVAREGLPPFQNLKISLSNYTGEARTYMEHLILATGAECTKTLRQENTHLITAHDQSEKCAAARDWNIHMINHLWLEESYAKWHMQSVAIPRYTHFPRRTNLGEVVGQTEIDRHVITKYFIESDDTEMIDADTADERAGIKLEDRQSPGVPRSARKTRISNGEKTQHHTPTADRHAMLVKQEVTPMTTGSRKSKEAAVAKLQELTPDIALYEKERKRVGGVTHGGRRKADTEGESVKDASRKRSLDGVDAIDDDESETKKPRKYGQASITMHLLISGYKRWIGKPKEEDAEIKTLRDLGITVVHEPSRATHLAVPHIVRTPKFVTAIAYAPLIISTDFIDACLAQNTLLSPEKFKLKDPTNEKKLGTTIKVSCDRARQNDHNLLAGRHIYVGEKIQGGFETWKSIVEANGGACMTYRGRHVTIPSKRAESGDTGNGDAAEEDPSNEVFLLCNDDDAKGAAPADVKLWTKFVKMAEGSRKTPRIVKSDWLLDTAMCQKIQPTGLYEIDVDAAGG